MAQEVRLGDVLRRRGKDAAHWLICRAKATGFDAECVKSGNGWVFGHDGMGWSTKMTPGIERVPDEEIPEELWPRIALLRLGFSEGDE
jgi:hypothetical protein